MLEDLLVAQDAAIREVEEVTVRASASSSASTASDTNSLKQQSGEVDETTGVTQKLPEEESDGEVLFDKPVAPPVEGSVNSDISTENAMAESPR